jgi:hypothetical protein
MLRLVLLLVLVLLVLVAPLAVVTSLVHALPVVD